jgi:hypothetical protein
MLFLDPLCCFLRLVITALCPSIPVCMYVAPCYVLAIRYGVVNINVTTVCIVTFK